MKYYMVKGYAFVPVAIEIPVQARDEKSAILKANRKFKKSGEEFIVGQSYDDAAVFEFVPSCFTVESE